MHINKVRQFAKQMGVNTYRMNKTEITRKVQQTENNLPCFATERVEYCRENKCLWRHDCMSANNGTQTCC